MTKKIKILTVLFILSIISININAQVNFGVKAGFNLANMNSNSSSKSIPAFHAGIIADAAINDFLSVQPNLLFTGKGVKYDFVGFTSITHIYYVELPILIKAHANLGGIDIYGLAGPAIGFGVAANNKSSLTDESVKLTFGSGLEDSFKPLDLGVMFGAGIETESGLLFGVSYDLGLSDMNPHNLGGVKKNGVLGISIGYLFNKN